MDTGDVGTIGGGRRKPTGLIDVALIQSLVRKAEVSDQIAGYGHLIVDECHHLSAFSFEMVARRSKARYVLGLSATVTRKDGHHPIIFMQCGPVRHRVDPKSQALRRGFAHKGWRQYCELCRIPRQIEAAIKGQSKIVGYNRNWPSSRMGTGSELVRNRIFGAIGVIWGGAILVRALLTGGPQGTGSYAAGQTSAFVFAGLLVLVGGYYFLKGAKKQT